MHEKYYINIINFIIPYRIVVIICLMCNNYNICIIN